MDNQLTIILDKLSLNTGSIQKQNIVLSMPRCGSWLTFEIIKLLYEHHQFKNYERYAFFRKINEDFSFGEKVTKDQYQRYKNSSQNSNFLQKLEFDSCAYIATGEKQDWFADLVIETLNNTKANIIYLDRRDRFEQICSWAIGHNFGYRNVIPTSNITIKRQLFEKMKHVFKLRKYVIKNLNKKLPPPIYYEDTFKGVNLKQFEVKKSVFTNNKDKIITNATEVKNWIKELEEEELI